ncbi:MAG: serine/threonine protein kinase [Clostridium sp.]|nr:serine/threonine protein kinase [Clostridium sp.]
MGNLTENYRLSLYTEVKEISNEKVYIVKSSLDDKIYIKKIVELENYDVYAKIKKLNISNIPKIYEIISVNNKLIIIEEYINGYSLKEILDNSIFISEKDLISYTIDLINILEELHSCNPVIIHRDIKPSNIMINNDGILKLIDFDISRLHKTNKSLDTIILGTYGYAAPEQYGFNQSDVRTDIYSVGVTMNIMLTGSLPAEEIYKGNLTRIISKCLELDPKKRYQSMSELKNALIKKQDKINKKNYSPIYKNSWFEIYKIPLKAIGFLWYLFIFMAMVGFFDQESISKERSANIILAAFLLILTLLYTNYKNIKQKLPIIKSSNILISILGYILYTLLLFVLFLFIVPM